MMKQTFVIPAKAGTQGVARDLRADWVPAFAGMTKCVGVSHALQTNPVTLNLFQGPFGRTGRSAVGKPDRAVCSSDAASEGGARWMLKQVQHDEIGEGRA
jgi:hypothetical protein